MEGEGSGEVSLHANNPPVWHSRRMFRENRRVKEKRTQAVARPRAVGAKSKRDGPKRGMQPYKGERDEC